MYIIRFVLFAGELITQQILYVQLVAHNYGMTEMKSATDLRIKSTPRSWNFSVLTILF